VRDGTTAGGDIHGPTNRFVQPEDAGALIDRGCRNRLKNYQVDNIIACIDRLIDNRNIRIRCSELARLTGYDGVFEDLRPHFGGLKVLVLGLLQE